MQKLYTTAKTKELTPHDFIEQQFNYFHKLIELQPKPVKKILTQEEIDDKADRDMEYYREIGEHNTSFIID